VRQLVVFQRRPVSPSPVYPAGRVGTPADPNTAPRPRPCVSRLRTSDAVVVKRATSAQRSDGMAATVSPQYPSLRTSTPLVRPRAPQRRAPQGSGWRA
jgi:hypothetical protein